jgi:hypothetical protein
LLVVCCGFETLSSSITDKHSLRFPRKIFEPKTEEARTGWGKFYIEWLPYKYATNLYNLGCQRGMRWASRKANTGKREMHVRGCLLSSMSRVLLEKLTGFQLVKKFPAFYGNRRFITAFTSAPPVPILNQINPVHAPPSHFLKVHLNIILPSTPCVFQVISIPQVPHQSLVCNFSLPRTYYMARLSYYSRFYQPNNVW